MYSVPPCCSARRLSCAGQLRIQRERVPRPGKALHARPRIIGRQIQALRHAGQLLLPVRELPLEDAALFQPAPLPDAVVGVLNRQRRQLGTPALAERVHDRAELPDQHAERPAVADDVVHVEHQDVLVLGEPDHLAAESGPLARSNGVAASAWHSRFASASRVSAVAVAEIDALELEVDALEDLLLGLAFLAREDRAQILVPRDDQVECLLRAARRPARRGSLTAPGTL